MKWLGLVLAWVAALALVAAVLVRRWRGRDLVLAGRFSPRVLRLAVLVLVVLGVGVERSRADEGGPKEPRRAREGGAVDVPAVLNGHTVIRWWSHNARKSEWAELKQEWVRVLEGPSAPAAGEVAALEQRIRRVARMPLCTLLLEELGVRGRGQAPARPSVASLLAALDSLEDQGMFDHWGAALVWQRSACTAAEERPALAGLYARIARHARLADTLIRARGEVKQADPDPRAWMSKAGPGRELRLAQQQLEEAARKLWPGAEPGAWHRDALVSLGVAAGSAPIAQLRDGMRFERKAGESVRFARLDLLAVPADQKAALEHAWLGRVELPAGTWSVWDLPGRFSPEGAARVRVAAAAALAGDEAAASKLEQALPLVHAIVREALRGAPEAKGAPRLRTLLALFDR